MKKHKRRFEVNATLMFREQDVAFLLNSIRRYTPINKDEEENRKYMLGILEYLSLP
jgi:hypothetical protein